MSKLREYAGEFVNRITNSFFVLGSINDSDLDSFNRLLIDTKEEEVSKNKKFSVDDLALVRIFSPEDFPVGLEFHTLQEDNKTATLENPFKRYLELIKYDIDEFKNVDVLCPHSSIDVSKLDLKYPLCRSTKHFSINGLVSNVTSAVTTLYRFNHKEIILIEPFSEHVDSSLVNLNPVDTFYNLKDGHFKIGKNGVIIMDDVTFSKLVKNPQIKDDLSMLRVFIYSPQCVNLSGHIGENIQTVITDIVLSFLGYVPQHSKNQCLLESESYFNGKNFTNDSKYLRLFQNYMEELNRILLGQSYYSPDPFFGDRKNTDRFMLDLPDRFPGKLHSQTRFAKEDAEVELNNKLGVIRRYLDFLVDGYGLDPDLADSLNSSFSQHIRDFHNSYYGSMFYFKNMESELLAYLQEIGYENLVKATLEFNSLPLKTDEYSGGQK